MSKKIVKKYIVIFDIDSASIGGGIFELRYDEKKVCVSLNELYATRSSITGGKEYPFEDFFAKTIKTLNKVAQSVYLHSRVPLEGLYCNVSIPWMSAQKRTIEYSKETPFILTQALADELIKKELLSPLHKNRDFSGHDVSIIDRKTIDVYGNGYRLRNPIDKEMNEVLIHSLTSVMSTSTKEAFEHEIEKVFHQIPTFVSNTFVGYYTLKSILPHVNDAIVLDISGEVTEVSVVTKDQLTHMGSIPVGIHTVVRSIRDTLNIPIQKAWNHILLEHQNHFSDEYRQEIKGPLNQAFHAWLKPLYHVLDEYAKAGMLPNTFVIKSHDNFINWFEEQLLSNEYLTEHMPTEGRVSVIQLKKKLLVSLSESGFTDGELDTVATFLSHNYS